MSDLLEELRHYSSASFAVPTRNGHGVPSNACRTQKTASPGLERRNAVAVHRTKHSIPRKIQPMFTVDPKWRESDFDLVIALVEQRYCRLSERPEAHR